jgi:hypothetical protein
MQRLQRLLFPEPVRVLPHARAWNIAFRTAHIAVTGILLGGHVFDVPEERLRTVLYLCIATGLALVALEAYPSCRWVYQGRGVLVLAKLALLCTIPLLWDYRVPILLAVVVIASVGSHMPARFRYYSLVHGRVLQEPKTGSAEASIFPRPVPDRWANPHSLPLGAGGSGTVASDPREKTGRPAAP